MKFSINIKKKEAVMKKYLLLIENEDLWEKFKKIIEKDINSEIISLIERKIKKGGKNEKN